MAPVADDDQVGAGVGRFEPGSPSTSDPRERRVAIACQGGGSHTASLRSGDRERAAELLGEFWDDNSARGPVDRLVNLWMVSAGVLQDLGVLPGVSPYVIPEPFSGMDQFRELLARHVDFDTIHADPADAQLRRLGGGRERRGGELHRRPHLRSPARPAPRPGSLTTSPLDAAIDAPTTATSPRDALTEPI